MLRLSDQFKIRLKLNEVPQYKIAQRAGVNPNVLSRLVRGVDQVRLDDARIHRVASVLGLQRDEAFVEDETEWLSA